MATAELLKPQFQEYTDEDKYKHYCLNEYQRICELQKTKRIKCIQSANQTLNLLSTEIKTAEGVYLDIERVGETKVLKRFEIPQDKNVMLLDMNLTLLKPNNYYISLMKSIGIEKEKCEASIEGFSFHERDNGKYSVFPNINGGSHNPYMRYKSNRSCASRRLKLIDDLSQLATHTYSKIKKYKRLCFLKTKISDNHYITRNRRFEKKWTDEFAELDACFKPQKITMMNLNLTFPKQISNLLFEDPDGVNKEKKIVELFWKSAIQKNVFTLDDKHYKTTGYTEQVYNKKTKKYKSVKKYLQLGQFSNIHEWGSYNPFDDHIHIHCLFPNFLYDPYNKCFVRIQPFLNSHQLSQLKKIWYNCQKETLGYGSDTNTPYSKFDISPGELNIFFQYLPGYTYGIDKPKKVEQTFGNQSDFMKYRDDLSLFNKNNNARTRLLHTQKYINRSHLIDVANYLDYKEFNYPDSSEDFAKTAAQFKHFEKRGSIKNRTSCTGYLRNMQKLLKEIDWDIYCSVYDPVSKKRKKIDRGAYKCPVTGQNMEEKPCNKTNFLQIKRLAIFIAYKSGMIHIGDMKFADTPFTKQKNTRPSVSVIIKDLERKHDSVRGLNKKYNFQFNKELEQSNKKQVLVQEQKRFSRHLTMQENKKINLDLSDTLHILAFGKC